MRQSVYVLVFAAVTVAAGDTSAQCQYEAMELSGPACNSSEAIYGLGPAGHAVGDYLRCSDGAQHAASWTEIGGFAPLPVPADAYSSRAVDVNTDGIAVGRINPFNGLGQATLWRDGKAHLLGFGGGDRSEASGVNDAGVVVGSWWNTLGGIP